MTVLQAQADTVLLQAISQCNTPGALQVCLQALAHLIQFYGPDHPSGPLVQALANILSKHYTHDALAYACASALTSLVHNDVNGPIVSEFLAPLAAEALCAVSSHARIVHPIPPQIAINTPYAQVESILAQYQQACVEADVASMDRIKLQTILLQSALPRATDVQLIQMLSAIGDISLYRNIPSDVRIACLQYVLKAISSKPSSRRQGWRQHGATAHAIYALAADDASRDEVIRLGGHTWLLGCLREGIASRLKKKSEIGRKKGVKQ